ncbi:uncharacterized protein K441DRAFT_699181 [Cenococcum geophilum 1.58]|uniref:uncharacterized protein n=1 Tax=Cenococcum geophilum 1.58 TaxID=794803 RepID=UPI0035900DEC|nr:hypothetical protein K441DRAFT_699181 [Cenococcum geophilum 1.58]
MSTTAGCTPSGVQRVGPLTTVFTPPSTCLHNLYVLDGGLFPDIAFLDFFAEDCSPSSAYTSLGSFTYDYYSPGICPFKYTSACGPTCLESPLSPLETGIKCCPSSYTCVQNVNWCVSILSTPTVATMTEFSVSSSAFMLTPSPTVSIFAAPVRVLYQSSDLSILTTAMAGHGSVTGNPSQGSPSSNGSLAASGLSKDRKIAVGVAVPLGSILIILAILYFCWRKRRRALETALPHLSDGWTKPELDGQGVQVAPRSVGYGMAVSSKSPKTKLDGLGQQQPFELEARDVNPVQLYEVPGDMPLSHELLWSSRKSLGVSGG